MAPSQTPEPYLTCSSPDYPFEKVVSDYFSIDGHKYLLYAGIYSGLINIVKSNEGEGNANYLKKPYSLRLGHLLNCHQMGDPVRRLAENRGARERHSQGNLAGNPSMSKIISDPDPA